jgi:tetratricopeptide (TPR) repeat protein
MFIILVSSISVFGQDIEIASEYMKNGELEKARTIYQKLAKNKEQAKVIHKKYLNCLVQLKDEEEAEKFLKKQIRNNENETVYLIDYARLLEKKDKKVEAKELYLKAIDKTKNDETQVEKLATDLDHEEQYDWAIEVLKTARVQQGNEIKYAKEIASLYRKSGKTELMIEEYLNYAKPIENRLLVQTIIQDNFKNEKEIELLEKVLYEKVQKYPNESYYNEMLIWHLVQIREFYRAFVQAKALDKRYKYEGTKVQELGFIAHQNKDFKASGSIFEYLVKEYPKSQNYPFFRKLLINSKEEVIKTNYPILESDIRLLIKEYQKMFDELGKNQKTMEALRNTANLYAFYLNEKDTAITVLNLAITLSGQDKEFRDKCKLDLGDITLLKGEPWEATLIYSQVEKSEKDNPMGNDAKLRNAKLRYYEGNFALAKEVLDVLKINTTREISNDAIDLSLLIQDNTGLDTSETAMKQYAAAELLLFQNRNDEALESLSEMYKKYPSHPLADEILWTKAKTYLKLNKVEKAVENLETILKDHSYDVLADDARFMLAKITEEKQNDKASAMKMYQQILIKYPGSIYGAEARKRFRILRGDTIN